MEIWNCGTDCLHCINPGRSISYQTSKDVSDVDSTGLGSLVFGPARLRKAGESLALLNLNRSPVKLFLLTRLAIAFEFFEDEQDAVDGFFPDRAPKHFDTLSFVQHEDDRDSDYRTSPEAAC